MIHGAVLALPDDRRPGKNDGQHGDVVDDPHHAGKPSGGHVRVERNSHIEIDRRQRHTLLVGEEIGDLGGDNLLRIAGSQPRLYHRRRIDVDLQRGLPSPQDIALEVGGNVDHEGKFPAVHRRNDIPFLYQLRPLKQWRKERMRDSTRKRRLILVDDRDRRIVQLLRIASGLQDHGEGKCIDHKSQKHEIVQKAAQFLDAKPVDIFDLPHRRLPHRSCLRSRETLRSVMIGTNTARASRLPARSK